MTPKAKSLETFFNEGVDARERGVALAENPYCPGTPERDEWSAGWWAKPDLDEEDDPGSSRIRRSDD